MPQRRRQLVMVPRREATQRARVMHIRRQPDRVVRRGEHERAVGRERDRATLQRAGRVFGEERTLLGGWWPGGEDWDIQVGGSVCEKLIGERDGKTAHGSETKR